MKTTVLSVLVLLACMGTAKSQVGINQNSPKASLDVSASSSSTSPDGVLVPRMTTQQLKLKDGAYDLDQHGALVYVTGGAPASDKTKFITAPGFYFYDSTVQASQFVKGAWMPLTGASQDGGEEKQELYINQSNYTLTGKENIIYFTYVGTTLLTVNKNITPEPPLGKIIYLQPWSGQLDVNGTGLRGDTVKNVYEKRAGMIIYGRGTDGNGQWLLIN